MIKLIVNADDFGYSRAVNFGIIDTYQHGILNSATLMTNMPGAEHAFELARNNPDLHVGIHLVLTCGRPILEDVSSLVDKSGNFKNLKVLLNDNNLNLDDVEKEWTAQIEKFLANGIRLTHFDSHHHVHAIPELLPIVQKLSDKYGLKVRRAAKEAIEGVPAFSDVFLHDFYGTTATYDYFEKIPTRARDSAIVEVMTHPGYLDNAILNGSSYNTDRLKELDILTSIKLPANIELYEFQNENRI
ncbi:chitin disaccharide deacetylase [Oceanobacillus sp. 143]|uniref:Carbohydrate deacetylase n=1 Tax=Oceanobacillus zhaokaii TaxID=2052660 RepID=A0A345PKI9_9BACI|nr:chitin disaccharide deacetylase [Oceanobacillus zhaokaii]AXI10519.1 chitin disaccharide deacetylase [Oceanobacillus zhaokaii]QGS69512.1 chitin disaccharide deacetylase [Oceanobacillus sp. 143]